MSVICHCYIIDHITLSGITASCYYLTKGWQMLPGWKQQDPCLCLCLCLCLCVNLYKLHCVEENGYMYMWKYVDVSKHVFVREQVDGSVLYYEHVGVWPTY